MNAREERGIMRLARVAQQLRSRWDLEDTPPMFERFRSKLETSVARLHEL
jgi:hypothetical protein